MRQMQLLPRLMFAGFLVLALAIIGTAISPVIVSADGGPGDPPYNNPKDTIEGIGDSALVGDSQADLTADSFDTGALLYETWTLLTII